MIEDIVTLSSSLAFIGRHGTLVMPSGIVVGLLIPQLTDLTRPLAEPLILVMFALSIYRLDPTEIRARLRRPAMVAFGVVWVLLLVPVMVFGLGYLFNLPPGLLIILTAWSACPPLVTIPGLAILLGLDGAAALLLMTGATILFPLTLPIVLAVLIGDGFGADPLAVAVRLMAIVLICCVAGQGARLLLGRRRVEASQNAADGVLVVLLAVFAVTIMGGLHRAMDVDMGRIPLFLFVAFAASAGLQLLSAGLFHRLPRASVATIALASGNRNFALLLPAVGTAFEADMWLYLGVVQFPIYILPMISKPLFRRYLGAKFDSSVEHQDK